MLWLQANPDNHGRRMIFHVTLELSETGEHVATCEQPSVQAHGLSPTNALDQLRRELRYQLELCPCSGIDADYIEFDTSSQGL